VCRSPRALPNTSSETRSDGTDTMFEVKLFKGTETTYGYDQASNLTSVERPKEGETAEIKDTYTYDGSGLREEPLAPWSLCVPERVRTAQRLSAEGVAVLEIAALLEVKPRTVSQYLRARSCPACGGPMVNQRSRHCQRCAAQRAHASATGRQRCVRRGIPLSIGMTRRSPRLCESSGRAWAAPRSNPIFSPSVPACRASIGRDMIGCGHSLGHVGHPRPVGAGRCRRIMVRVLRLG
jgi:YD repeat-containing protein